MNLLNFPNEILANILSNFSDHEVIKLVRDFPQFLNRVNPIQLKDYYTTETIRKRTQMENPTRHFRFNLYPNETPDPPWNIQRIQILQVKPESKNYGGILTPDYYRNTTVEDLFRINLGHLEEVEAWFQLLKLEIRDSPLIQLPPDFGTLSQLTHLTLVRCGLTDLSLLGNYPSLINLDVSYNKIRIIKRFQSWPKLEKLNLAFNQLTTLPSFDPLPNLDILDITGNMIESYPSSLYDRFINIESDSIIKFDWTKLPFDEESTHFPISRAMETMGLISTPEFDKDLTELWKFIKINHPEIFKSLPIPSTDNIVHNLGKFSGPQLQRLALKLNTPNNRPRKDLQNAISLIVGRTPDLKKSTGSSGLDLTRVSLTPANRTNNFYTMEELKQFCRDQGLSEIGNKNDLVSRLTAPSARPSIPDPLTRLSPSKFLRPPSDTPSAPKTSRQLSVAPPTPKLSTSPSAPRPSIGLNPARLSVQPTNKSNNFYTVEQLKQFCRDRGVSPIGTKAELVARLI